MVATNLLQYLSQSLSASITSAARPALTFFLIQFSIFISSYLGWLVIEPNMGWMLNPVVVLIGGVLATLEGVALHDEDVAMFLLDFKINQFMGTLGTFSSALLFTSIGLPSEEAIQMMNELTASATAGINPDALEATTVIVTSYAGDNDSKMIQMGTIAFAVGSNSVLTYGRGRLQEFIDDLELLSLWQKIETGGVVGALILLLLAPVICLFLLLVVVVVGAFFGLMLRGIKKRMDDMARYECPHCMHRIRKEAVLCFSCHTDLEPQTLLVSTDQKQGLLQTLFPKKIEARDKAIAEGSS
jgi:hypothetical protein